MILLSAFGTSDPIRDLRDGPLLHILRHYRPDKVMILLSKEIDEYCQKDDRLGKIQEHMKKNWNYEPVIIPVCIATKNPHIISEVAGPIHHTLKNFVESYPDEEVLINLSSGTPMMKTVLSMESLNPNYKGIQVSNPEKRAGRDQTRSNHKGYDIDTEIALNLDDEEQEDLLVVPAELDRCSESELAYIKLREQMENIKGLLHNYDYASLAQLSELPTHIIDLAKHLNERKNLNISLARTEAKKLELPYSLYPENKNTLLSNKQLQEARIVIDYYMSLMLLKRTAQYSDFLLRLNPLIVNIQEALIRQLLTDNKEDIIKTRGNRSGEFLLREDIKRFDKELLDFLDEIYPYGYDDEKFFNINLGNKIVDYYTEKGRVDPKISELLHEIEKLNSFRNSAAHTLILHDKDIIEKNNKFTLDELEIKLNNLLQTVYPIVSSQLLNIYDISNEYILDYLDTMLE